MNNTIFRRKFIFAVLIAFVLGFGVQGVVDADLNEPSNLRGDLQIKPLVTNQTFEFSFYISGIPGSRPDVDGSPDTEREEITITANTGNNITEVRMGSTPYTNSDTDFTLEEWHTDSTNGSPTDDDADLGAGEGDLTTGTVTVKVEPTAIGSITVTVATAGNSAGDFENLIFTAYAVRVPANVQDLRFAASTPTVNPTTKTTYPPFDPTNSLYDEEVLVTLGQIGATGAGASSWVLVDFEVIEGPGFVYQDLNNDSQPDPGENRNSKTTRTLTRDYDGDGASTETNIARVRLRTNGGTNKIRATITNTQPAQTYEITYIYQGEATTPPTQQPTESLTVNAPATATGGTPISVTATTSDNRSGQLVVFTSTGGTFASASVPTAPGGVATIQFTPPRSGGSVTITASATGYRAGTATVQVTSALPSLTVSTPRPISGNAGETLNIVVGAGTANVLITLSGVGFTAATGVTGTNGFVTIPIDLPNTAGSYQLYANAAGYERELIVVIVSGTATTGVPVRLTIPSGTNRVQTGTIGSSATLRVRVTRTDTNAAQSGVEVTFRDSSGNTLPSGTVDTDGNGDATYQYAVSSTARRLISAVITDTEVDKSGATPVTFEITGTAQQPTTSTRLSIFQPLDSLGQPVTIGAPGAPYTLTIRLDDANGNPAVNQPVTLTVTNSTGNIVGSPTAFTVINGTISTQDTFKLPTAPGQYTITAVSGNAITGVETAFVTVTVFAVSLVKASNDSTSGDNQEGNRGEVLDDPFALRVVRDSDNTAVQGVPVIWTVTDGDGELSESSTATSGSNTLTVRSDSNGDVEVYLVLDEDDEDNEVTASVGITGVADVTFEATGSLVPDDLVIVSGNNQRIAVNQRSAPMIVHVTDEDGDDLEGVTVSFSMRGGSGTLTPRSAETDRLGEAEAELLPRAAGTYFITARVVGVTSVTFTITVGDLADDIEIVSGNNQSGDPGTELDDPFVVEVLDEDGDTVSGVTVTFSVTDGGGSLSATSDTTDSRGRAETYLTLGDEPGRNSVRASVSGVSTRVTFTATAVDPAPPEPDVRLPASRRADTYWINTDGGTLHRLVGNNVEDIAPSVENVVSLVVTSNRLYWVEKTSNNSGRIRRSNLNGSNIQLIRDLSAAPAGITVDTASNTIYLTNERGKVQAINIDGSGYVPNLVISLTDPTDIAVGDGKIYWITGDGTVQSADVDGSGVTTISSGHDTLNSIAVSGGKVYWTEQTGDDSGKIHSANLNGRGIEELRTTRGAPYGISYDADDDKIYWADSLGRIMQGNRDASTIRAVVTNLVSLGDIAVPSGTTAPRPPGTFSRYDVNRDGVVDNTDAALVANALGESPPSDPRLDVNGDGVVNFLDLLLVFDNRDESNAAPVAVAKNLLTVSREEIQNQIEQLLASDNQSATALYTLAYLQSLLEVVTPEQTRLLANYPNPFNPETWIPYQLATSSDVQITIYNSAGREVRTLSLGHQSKGYYTDRSRAAYWDGRNAIGEHVASGVYFYTLITDRMSATRKMLILK
ncbi:T9SS type A sorting domain-containing protein [Candidatus Poribacteria bacterium]|nr:T9SS type A sorting domain-containing protein [Candidatus Poribacteria bacterium]